MHSTFLGCGECLPYDYLCISKSETVNEHLTFYLVSLGELRSVARAVTPSGQLSGEEALRCPGLRGSPVRGRGRFTLGVPLAFISKPPRAPPSSPAPPCLFQATAHGGSGAEGPGPGAAERRVAAPQAGPGGR